MRNALVGFPSVFERLSRTCYFSALRFQRFFDRPVDFAERRVLGMVFFAAEPKMENLG
jgi:hypothetical protein